MAEATKARPAGTDWRAMGGRVAAFLTDRTFSVPALTSGLFLFTFVVYWIFGPQETPYLHHVNQANNWLHGHLDLKPEYSLNLNTLEAAHYDGESVCDPALGDPDCKTYMVHPPMPAILMVPFVLVQGLEVNQALWSAVLGGLTAALVFRITRSMTEKLMTAVILTVFFTFGTIFWYIAAHGGIWYFSHTVGIFFLFAAVYFTLTNRNPLLAGLCLGAAFLSRVPMIFGGFFFVIMLSEFTGLAEHARQQTVPAFIDGLARTGGRLLRPLGLKAGTLRPVWLWLRVNSPALFQFGVGVGVCVIAYMVLNYVRFDDPFNGGHNLSPQVEQEHLQSVYSDGIQDISYIPRHIAVMFELPPIFSKQGSYVWPSFLGTAIWVTSPALLYAYFPSVRNRRLALVGAGLLALACGIIMTQALARVYWPDSGWGDPTLFQWERLPGIGPGDVGYMLKPQLLPFWIMLVVGITSALRLGDRLVLACWAGIIPIAFFVFIFAATGWTQFGYRYATDFYPFLFLLVVAAVGHQLRWHHYALIAASILVNIWGVLWAYQFDQHRWLSDLLPSSTDGWTWFSF